MEKCNKKKMLWLDCKLVEGYDDALMDYDRVNCVKPALRVVASFEDSEANKKLNILLIVRGFRK